MANKNIYKIIMYTKEYKANLIHDTLLNYLKKKEKTEEEAIMYLIEQGISKEKSKMIVEKLLHQIRRHKKYDKLYHNLFGLVSIVCGIACLSLENTKTSMLLFILAGKLLWSGLKIDLN